MVHRSHSIIAVMMLLLCTCSPQPVTPQLATKSVSVDDTQLISWPLTTVPNHGVIGRGPAPVVLQPAAAMTSTLQSPVVWQVPQSKPPRAVIAGNNRGVPNIEMVDIDDGKIQWRDATVCTAPIVTVTAKAIVCADGHGTRAVAMDGRLLWSTPGMWVVANSKVAAVTLDGETQLIDLESGQVLQTLAMPVATTVAMIRGICQRGATVHLALFDGASLLHVVVGANAKLTMAWKTALTSAVGLPNLDVATAAGECNDEWLAQSVAVDSATTLSSITFDKGVVPRQDGTMLVSTAKMVRRFSRRLDVVGDVSQVPPFGRLLAHQDDTAIVAFSQRTVLRIEPAATTTWIELQADSMALGSRFLVTGNRRASAAETAHRFMLPPSTPLPSLPNRPPPPLQVAAELRDLPVAVSLAVDKSIVAADQAAHWVGSPLIDPGRSEQIFVITLATQPSDKVHAGVSCLNLATSQWRWHAVDGCGPGSPLALAKADNVVACAAQTFSDGATVVASDDNGKPTWNWRGESITKLAASGMTVMTLNDHQVQLLDSTTGAVAAVVNFSPATLARAALVRNSNGSPFLLTTELGRVVVRSSMANAVPLWSLGVHGVVESIQDFDGRALVSLEDGDRYIVDIANRSIHPVATVSDRVVAMGDLVSSETLEPDGIWQQALLRHDGSIATRNDYAMTSYLPPLPGTRPVRRVEPIRTPPDPGRKPVRVVVPVRPPPLLPPPPRIRRFPASANYVRGSGASEVLLWFSAGNALAVDGSTGTPRALVTLPQDATGAGFATVVDGVPRTGVFLRAPLRAVLF
jgi:hypothetical protein